LYLLQSLRAGLSGKPDCGDQRTERANKKIEMITLGIARGRLADRSPAVVLILSSAGDFSQNRTGEIWFWCS
jgi:hypothetical protein